MSMQIIFSVIVIALIVASFSLFFAPLRRRKDTLSPASNAAESEIDLLKKELLELDKEVQSGRVGEDEVRQTRSELGRVLLRLSRECERDSKTSSGPTKHKSHLSALILALITLPLISLSFYFMNGHPDFIRFTAQDRLLAAKQEQREIEAQRQAEAEQINILIAEVEKRQRQDPDNVRGWKLLAPVYARLGRLDKAQQALEHVIRLEGETAVNLANVGEIRIMAQEGRMSEEAKALFERALVLDPKNIKARFFLAFNLREQGKLEQALESWRTLVFEAEALEQAPSWLTRARQEMTEISAELGRAGGSDENKALSVFTLEQQERISSMVAGLANRLENGGGSLEEWQRLIRSYSVLGLKEAARASFESAKQDMKDDPEAIKSLTALAQEFDVIDKGITQ